MSDVPELKANVDKPHTIQIDGLESAAAVPWPTETSNELYAGIWHAGADIEPGTYTMKALGGFGYVVILNSNGTSQIFEMIRSQSVETESEIEVKDG